jgi:short-subunit dehydrogenase
MDNRAFKHEFGPVALVTGASSGIGKSFAEVLASIGLDLVLVARRRQRLEELAARLREQYSVQVTLCQVDLARSGASAQILDDTAELDVGLLVSNAGFGIKAAHAASDPQTMTDMLMVNCHVPMLLSHGFIPRLRARGNGGMIFTSSVEGLMGCPYSAAYSASKAMLISLGEALWGELAPEGIKVLTLCPGPTDTEAAALQGMDPAKIQGMMSPDEVARLALENIDQGPTFVSHPHYKAMFERMLAMPRRDALAASAKALKALISPTGRSR